MNLRFCYSVYAYTISRFEEVILTLFLNSIVQLQYNRGESNLYLKLSVTVTCIDVFQ